MATIYYPSSLPVPAPTPSTLGGVFSFSGVAHQWIDAINTDGSVSSSQPAFTDISGILSTGQLPSTLIVTAATPVVTSGQIGFGTTTGFGNGSSGTAVTTTTKSTGTGPATPQTVVDYMKVNIGGTDYWVPLMQ